MTLRCGVHRCVLILDFCPPWWNVFLSVKIHTSPFLTNLPWIMNVSRVGCIKSNTPWRPWNKDRRWWAWKMPLTPWSPLSRFVFQLAVGLKIYSIWWRNVVYRELPRNSLRIRRKSLPSMNTVGWELRVWRPMPEISSMWFPWSIDWLIDWFVDQLAAVLIDWLIDFAGNCNLFI